MLGQIGKRVHHEFECGQTRKREHFSTTYAQRGKLYRDAVATPEWRPLAAYMEKRNVKT